MTGEPDLEERVSWLRRDLAVVRPELAELPIRLALHTEQSKPQWQRCSAFVGAEWVVKFAWTDIAADRLRTEIAIRRALSGHGTGVPLPELVAASDIPAILIARFVAGGPVTGVGIAMLGVEAKRDLARGLAGTLAALHSPRVLALIEDTDLVI